MTSIAAGRPRSRRTPLIILALSGLSIVAIFSVFGLLDRYGDSRKEAYSTFYAEVPQVERQCPPLVPEIRQALADRFISRLEAKRLSVHLKELSGAYRDAVDMRAAKAKLGIPVPGPLPPACDSRYSPDSSIDLFFAI